MLTDALVELSVRSEQWGLYASSDGDVTIDTRHLQKTANVYYGS